LCDPESFFQFGALWYVFLSSSFFTIYLYFRTDYWKDGEGAELDDLINQVAGAAGGRRIRNGRDAGKAIGGGGNRSRAGSSTAGSRRGAGSFTSAANSQAFTPQLWLSSGALYGGEVILGIGVCGFVVWVVYFAYTNA
jgi:hypothetical protein